MSHLLPPLPFAPDALQPYVSDYTLNLHYGKHHAGYVASLQQQIRGTELERTSLAEIVRVAWKTGNLAVFNNAAQAWNHEFFWSSLSPRGLAPTGPIAGLIDRDFGNLHGLNTAIVEAALNHFGSGWVWLVLESDRLRVVTTANADLPLLYQRQLPLLTIDVWEHSYYLDYQNDRKRYLEAVTAHLLNWTRANERLQARSTSAVNKRVEIA